MIIFVDRGSWAAWWTVELAALVATEASPWVTSEAFEPVTGSVSAFVRSGLTARSVHRLLAGSVRCRVPYPKGDQRREARCVSRGHRWPPVFLAGCLGIRNRRFSPFWCGVAARVKLFFLKVWWPYATLFAFIFLLCDRYIHTSFIHSYTFAEAHLHFFTAVTSRDSNSGLPYSKPARYQLSHAALNSPQSSLEESLLCRLVELFNSPRCDPRSSRADQSSC